MTTQTDLLGSTAPSTSLIGLTVVLPRPCRSCGETMAVIGSSKGPHHDRHVAWMSREVFDFVCAVIDHRPASRRNRRALQRREGKLKMPTKALQAALELAATGLPVFPCLADKSPATPHGFKDAVADPDGIRALWGQHPGELVGVPTGMVSGFDVLDLDIKHVEATTWWNEHRHRFPRTRIHQTRSSGMHLIFKRDDAMRCSAGKIVLASIPAPMAGT